MNFPVQASFTRVQATFLSIFCVWVGLLVSKFLLSIGMLGCILVGFAPKHFRQSIAHFAQHKTYWAITSIFLIVLFSGIYTENWADMSSRLRVKLPLLLLPIAFAGLPKLSTHQIFQLFAVFISLTGIAAIGVLVNYALHFEAVQQALSESRWVPTPNGDHIRFSLMTAWSSFLGFYLYRRAWTWRFAWTRTLWLFLGILLFITLHITAVRSGLLALYLCLLVWGGYTILKRRKFSWLIFLVGLSVSLPFLAYYTVPSFRVKVNLTMKNIELYQAGEMKNYSDTQRLVSYEMGLRLGADHPIFGVGYGDVRQSLEPYYAAQYPELPVKMPHNQFITFFAASGLVGCLLFSICVVFPLFYRQYFQDTLLVIWHVLILSSFLTENTLDRSIGVTFYTVFLLLLLFRKMPAKS